MNALTVILSIELAIIGSTIYDAIKKFPSKLTSDLAETIIICIISYIASFILQKFYPFYSIYINTIQLILYILFISCFRARNIKLDKKSPVFEIFVLTFIIIAGTVIISGIVFFIYIFLIVVIAPSNSFADSMDSESIWITSILFNFIVEYFFVNKSILLKLIEDF